MMESGSLIWFQQYEVGYVHPVVPYRYGKEYFDKYIEMARLQASDKLLVIRENVVRDRVAGGIVDVGAGACVFVEHMRRAGYRDTKGYDVNPWTVQVLMNSQLYRDPWDGPKPKAITLWDVLEHMECPEAIIDRAASWVFVSVPIFEDAHHARRSKHYRPDEHIWYFTESGLVEMFRRCGFSCEHRSHKEEDAGREGIGTYAFRRTAT